MQVDRECPVVCNRIPDTDKFNLQTHARSAPAALKSGIVKNLAAVPAVFVHLFLLRSIRIMSDFVPPQDPPEPDLLADIQEPRLWRGGEWTARVIKNDDDEGWAVAMTKTGEVEPALVGPWTMGRDKKNPKPLDTGAFNTLVKTAAEVLRRHEQQLHAQLHRTVMVSTDTADFAITLDIVPDEDDPFALLTARDAAGEQLAQVRVNPGFKLTRASAVKWIENDFRKPS